jgi:hypothetical protein
MKCCENEHSSQFCPDCGKKLSQHPLHSLLKYMRSTRKGLETLGNKRLDGHKEYLRTHPDPDRADWITKQEARLLGRLAKWDEWISSVEDLLGD